MTGWLKSLWSLGSKALSWLTGGGVPYVYIAAALAVGWLIWSRGEWKADYYQVQAQLTVARDARELAESSARQKSRTIDGLQDQVAASYKSKAELKDQLDAIGKIMAKASNVTPARAGEVVDDETSRAAAAHLNALFGVRGR